ncbi:MAG: hypothetical protein AAF497_28735, partial [Planctomycetota bacterium]
MNFPDQSNYGGYDYQSAPKRRGGCGSRFMLFLIIFAIAMFLLRPRTQPTEPREPSGNQRPIGSTMPDGRRNPIGNFPRSDTTKPGSDTDDWSIEELKSSGG